MLAKVVLGTRGSELARMQAQLVAKAIRSFHPTVAVHTKIIATKGDDAKIVDPFAGRKGLFTAKIERAVLTEEIDVAVHSAKDLPSEPSLGAKIAAVLPRAPIDDVLVSKHRCGLAGLPAAATVATGSIRRKRQLHWQRADLNVIDLRGNVLTRLRKLAQNNWDAIVLARAGLERLGFLLTHAEIDFEGRQFFLEVLPHRIFLPAGGQGIVALQIRANDQSTHALLEPVNDRDTLLCLEAEREFLRGLHGDCNFPVGVLATISDGKMKMRAQLFEAGSQAPQEVEVGGSFDAGETLATQLLRMIRQDCWQG
jgi:hydroxymethylbilane synthase